MNLTDRTFVLSCIFDDLQSTTSLNEKRRIVDEVPSFIKEDFEYCVECLNGLHKFGYTYKEVDLMGDRRNENNTVKEILQFLQEPILRNDLSEYNIAKHISQTYEWADFFEPIVNRTLKLGIGKSILPKDGLSAMLAKKYEGSVKYSKDGYYITEKLDGNRCIARYDGTRWIFTSRNGKEMHVNFDMSGLPKEYIYDGEILAPQQVSMSQAIYELIVNDKELEEKYGNIFNSTSGLINRHTLNKELVYNIFDVVPNDAIEYKYRRAALDGIAKSLNNGQVRVLPVLAHFKDAEELNFNVGNILDKIVLAGGEGVMINLGSGNYQHKRTDQLLKYKQVQSMDMRVTGLEWGTGKYEGMIGALKCHITTGAGLEIGCKVGSGLSDEQRLRWAIHPEEIVGRIVEVGYFSMSQSKNTINSEEYSLRFPRLKSVRKDKVETSEH